MVIELQNKFSINGLNRIPLNNKNIELFGPLINEYLLKNNFIKIYRGDTEVKEIKINNGKISLYYDSGSIDLPYESRPWKIKLPSNPSPDRLFNLILDYFREKDIYQTIFYINFYTRYFLPDSIADELEERTIIEIINNLLKNDITLNIPIDCKHNTIYVLGDLHGDIIFLIAFLEYEKIVERLMMNENIQVVFLGDLIDRSRLDHNVLRTVLLLKTLFPDRIIWIRGNHDDFDTRDIERVEETTLDEEYYIVRHNRRFSKEYFNLLDQLFERLPYFMIANLNNVTRAIFIHGGVPPFDSEGKFPYFKSLYELNTKIPFDDNIQIPLIEYSPIHLTWASIQEIDNCNFNSSSSRYTFGRRELDNFLQKIGVQKMIKGHDPTNIFGFQSFFNNKVFVLHSTGGRTYTSGAFSQIQYPSYMVISNKKLKLRHFINLNNRILDLDYSYPLITLDQNLD